MGNVRYTVERNEMMTFILRVLNYTTANAAIYVKYLRKQYYIYRKISNIYKRIDHSKRLQNSLKLYREKWSILSKFVFSKYYRVYSSISGKDTINYVPENIYYLIIEPRLNDTSLSRAYADKNSYDKLPFSTLFPKTCIRNIDGVFYDQKYNYISLNRHEELLTILEHFAAPKVILKPSVESQGGRNIELFSKDNGVYRNVDNDMLDINFLQTYRDKNYIVQEAIEQHPFYMQLNSSSLNTVRVFTYRSTSTEDVAVLHCVVRMGMKGSVTDNQSAGGISCGIDESGKLNDFAVNKKGDILRYMNEGDGISFGSIGNPYKLNEIKEMAKECAMYFHYHRILSFDFCVDKKGDVRLIEINNDDMGINFLQMNNGPLFGKYTDEVIEYCKNNQK